MSLRFYQRCWRFSCGATCWKVANVSSTWTSMLRGQHSLRDMPRRWILQNLWTSLLVQSWIYNWSVGSPECHLFRIFHMIRAPWNLIQFFHSTGAKQTDVQWSWVCEALDARCGRCQTWGVQGTHLDASRLHERKGYQINQVWKTLGYVNFRYTYACEFFNIVLFKNSRSGFPRWQISGNSQHVVMNTCFHKRTKLLEI